MWWGSGAELLLTRTKDNARLPKGNAGPARPLRLHQGTLGSLHVPLMWVCWLLVDPAPR